MSTPARRISFEDACARYVHRFTQDHVPRWALVPLRGKYYAPQYASDREWYARTIFPGEPGHHAIDSSAYSTQQSWPLGHWLEEPYTKGGRRAVL